MSLKFLGPRFTGIASFLAMAFVIEGAIRIGLISQYVVPLPSDILFGFRQVITEENLLSRILLTFGEVLAAGALVAVFGISIGVLLDRLQTLKRATETFIAAFAAAPIVLAYPLFMVIFGRNALTIIMIGFVAGLAPVILKTIEGMSGVRGSLLNVGRSFNLTPQQQFWKIQFPAAVPTIFTGLRLGLIFTMITIVGVEFLINFGGLGQLINELAERYELAGTYAAIVFVVFISIAFFTILESVESWLRPKN
ncbi:ABC transporter permease [Rhizobium sp. P28RR-XV]|uniref:ABC transporter permease n=1 Tax=Rhizobium sp. P28RR-XV TaxID=2726737 RepID=UPI001456B50F|nr:ABC transporter permease subunit [Rhizobium sp. P28RR-XV]NLR88204.1 ABC transporter permease subunit [Rhizobium sp. P28RR-XV]